MSNINSSSSSSRSSSTTIPICSHCLHSQLYSPASLSATTLNACWAQQKLPSPFSCFTNHPFFTLGSGSGSITNAVLLLYYFLYSWYTALVYTLLSCSSNFALHARTTSARTTHVFVLQSVYGQSTNCEVVIFAIIIFLS